MAGSRASAASVVGNVLNHVGGSAINVSLAGYAPTTGLAAPRLFSQFRIPLRPLPPRVSAVRPTSSAPVVRKFPPFAPAPRYPPPLAKNAVSRVRASGFAAEGQAPVLKTTS